MNRLGRRKNTEISGDQTGKIQGAVNRARVYLDLKGCYSEYPITAHEDTYVILNDTVKLESCALSEFLKDSSSVYLVGVTAGMDIVAYRDTLMKDNNMFDAVITDAVGSESVEAACAFIHELIKNMKLKEGRKVTKRRYSPGYGDFNLEYQKVIEELLPLDEIGISVAPTYILHPEKSITAIIGMT